MMLVSAGSLKTVTFAGRMDFHPPRFSIFTPSFDALTFPLSRYFQATSPAADFTTIAANHLGSSLPQGAKTN